MDEEEREERDRQRDGGETGSSEKIDKKRGRESMTGRGKGRPQSQNKMDRQTENRHGKYQKFETGQEGRRPCGQGKTDNLC